MARTNERLWRYLNICMYVRTIARYQRNFVVADKFKQDMIDIWPDIKIEDLKDFTRYTTKDFSFACTFLVGNQYAYNGWCKYVNDTNTKEQIDELLATL